MAQTHAAVCFRARPLGAAPSCLDERLHDMDTQTGSSGTGLTKGSTVGILASTVVAAVSTLAITMVAYRGLSQDGDATKYADFMVFWALLFGVYGVVVGVQNEATRAVGTCARQVEEGRRVRPGPRVVWAALLLASATAGVLVVASPWWGPRLVPASMPGVVPAVAVGVILYAVYEFVLGSASGMRQWSVYSLMVSGDGVIRLLLVASVAFMGLGLLAFEVACVVATFFCLVLAVLFPRGRRVLVARGDVGWIRLLRNNLLSCVSSASTAILITAFPAIIKLTAGAESAAVLGGTITAISLTRSPILMPLQAFQGVAITAFLREQGNVFRLLLKPVMLLCVIGVPASALAGLVGPWAMGLLYGSAITAGPWTFVGLTLAAIPLAVVTLTGTAAVACNAHVWFSAGWFTAAVVASALLFLPVGLPTRVCVGLFTGPLVGMLIHLEGIRRTRDAAIMRATAVVLGQRGELRP